MRWLLVLFLAIVLSGCSLPQKSSDTFKRDNDRLGVPKRVRYSSSLWSIEIDRYDSRVFSGLVVVRRSDFDLSFALLDSMGVTLLAVRNEFVVEELKPQRNRQVTGILKDSGMAELLSTTFERIFLLEPESTPCARNGLLSFCKRNERAGFTSKEARLGPFLYWRSEAKNYSKDSEGKGSEKFIDCEWRGEQQAGQTALIQDNHRIGIEAYCYRQPWIGVSILLKEK